MTKLEALAKDCIENHTHRLVDKPTKQDIYLREESIFIQGYRQSEKRIAELEKELKAEKEYSATLRKEIDEFTNSHTLCAKYKELEKAYNEAEEFLDKQIEATYKLFEENKELKNLVEKYRQAVDKCLHITFMGGGCEVNTIGQYATLVDGYLTDVEGLAKWKN